MGTLKKPSSGQGVSETPSRIDLFSGKHTNSLIVGVLILLIFLGFVITLCITDVKDNFVTGVFSLLGVLAGFFAGTMTGKKNK